MRVLGKHVFSQGNRGFESLPLRQPSPRGYGLTGQMPQYGNFSHGNQRAYEGCHAVVK